MLFGVKHEADVFLPDQCKKLNIGWHHVKTRHDFDIDVCLELPMAGESFWPVVMRVYALEIISINSHTLFCRLKDSIVYLKITFCLLLLLFTL